MVGFGGDLNTALLLSFQKSLGQLYFHPTIPGIKKDLNPCTPALILAHLVFEFQF